jgi:hypothetical protein
MIAILCADEKSNYFKCSYDLDIYTISRSALNFTGTNKVICHPPCAQFSRMKAFSKKNVNHLELAKFCVETILKNGGILEQPMGSNMFKFFGLDYKKVYSVNQSWWGFRCTKKTILYFEQCKPLQMPITFNAPAYTVCELHSSMRSRMTIEFCEYLIKCVKQ